jgi:hypothetical protein
MICKRCLANTKDRRLSECRVGLLPLEVKGESLTSTNPYRWDQVGEPPPSLRTGGDEVDRRRWRGNFQFVFVSCSPPQTTSTSTAGHVALSHDFLSTKKVWQSKSRAKACGKIPTRGIAMAIWQPNLLSLEVRGGQEARGALLRLRGCKFDEKVVAIRLDVRQECFRDHLRSLEKLIDSTSRLRVIGWTHFLLSKACSLELGLSGSEADQAVRMRIVVWCEACRVNFQSVLRSRVKLPVRKTTGLGEWINGQRVLQQVPQTCCSRLPSELHGMQRLQ